MAPAWAGVVVAAIEANGQPAARPLGWLAAAALALPGVMPPAAQAEEAPEKATVAAKYLHYSDSQAVQTRYPYNSGQAGGTLQRITVDAPSLMLSVPLGRRWLVEASGTVDKVSGASPRYYSDVSGASQMSDRRTAGDARVTHYFERVAIAVGGAQSSENDYVSKAWSAEVRAASADNNTTYSLALGGARDTIRPTGGGVLNVVQDQRSTQEVMLSVTSALTPVDLVQLSLGQSRGRGYFSDPYKQFDRRPRERDISTYLMRWNHHVEALGITQRASYRYYSDSYDVRAHSVDLQWVLPLTGAWKLTPALRYHTQSSASFYFDPVTDLAVYPGTLGQPTYSAVDQRLSAFGALTVGLKTEFTWRSWTVDLKLERYEQRPAWRLGGEGSLGLDPFRATMLQAGLAYSF